MLIELVGIPKLQSPRQYGRCSELKMETIWLQRPSGDIPWGFRLQGGQEYDQPLSVQRVTPGSVADNGLTPGDIVLKIGNVNATNITHSDAQDVIRGASNILQFTIKKGAIVSAPVSPQYSGNQQSGYSKSPYVEDDKYSTLPDYKTGSGYSNGHSSVNSSGNNYDQGNSPYDMRQFEQAVPVSGYSTLPVRNNNNKQNNESFRPVNNQQQNKYPYKATAGIKLQMKPQVQNDPHENFQQDSYNNRPNYPTSSPMSPVQYPNEDRTDSPYQRQTSVGSNNQRQDTNNYPQSHYRKPTPYTPPVHNNQNGSATPPTRLHRQTSSGSNVYESTISPGFQPGSFLPKTEPDEIPPPTPPPPTNYQPEQYGRPSFDQGYTSGPGQLQRQTSQQRVQYDPRQNELDQYKQRQQPGMYVDTNQPNPPYQRQGSRPYDYDGSQNTYQQQPPPPPQQYYDRQGNVDSPSYQRQPSYGAQQPPPPPPPQQQNYPYTPEPSYNRQQSREQPQQISRQQSRDQNQEPPHTPSYGQPNFASSPQSAGSGINSFEDILSPFEKFQNSNYCDKLFARSPADQDSGVHSDYQSQSLSSDTPRSNQSSNYSEYSPPQTYSGGYDDRGTSNQSLLRPAPPAPPPPAITPPPPPPPPPPPSDWAPQPRKIPAHVNKPDIGGENAMPDKVLNTMLKNAGTQKPFSYMPTAMDLKKFKDKARARGQPRNVMPRGYAGVPIDSGDESPAEIQRPKASQVAPATGIPKPETGVYKHAQYNSPLRVYSNDNAKDAFDVQSGGQVDVAGVNSNHYTPSRNPQQFITLPQKTVRTPERRASDIKESEVYKMIKVADAKGKDDHVIHLEKEADISRDRDRMFSPPPTRGQGLSFRVLQWMTDTVDDDDNINKVESYQPKKPRNPLLRHNSEDDEMRFSGLHTKADIPSKAFQRVHKLSASNNNTPVDEKTSQKYQEEPEEPERVGNYDEASIRYRGNYIPSPSFRLLQSMAKEDEPADNNSLGGGMGVTDSEDDGLPDRLNDEDMVDKRYTGGNIPSRSFKALQMYMDDDKEAGADGDDKNQLGGPKIKVINRSKSPQTLPKPNKPVAASAPAPTTDF